MPCRSISGRALLLVAGLGVALCPLPAQADRTAIPFPANVTSAPPCTTTQSITGIDDHAPHGVKTAVLKKALRKLASMLRSHELDKVLRWFELEDVGHVAKVVRKHSRSLADVIDDLIKLEGITLSIVEGQMRSALIFAGVSQSTARETAFWIKNFISWTLL